MKHSRLYKRIMTTNQKIVVIEGTEFTRYLLQMDGCQMISAPSLIGEPVASATGTVWSKPKSDIDLGGLRPLVIRDVNELDPERLDALFWKIYKGACATKMHAPVIFLEEPRRHCLARFTARYIDRCARFVDHREWKRVKWYLCNPEFVRPLTTKDGWLLIRAVDRGSCIDPTKTLRLIRRIPEE